MLIGKKWKIGADSQNVILYRKKKRTRKDTNEVYWDWETLGYFATVENALQELVNQGVRDTQLKDLETIVAEIKKLGILLRALPKNLTAL